MSRRKTIAGATGVTVAILGQDTRSTSGAGLAGLAWNSSGLAAKYRRAGQAAWTPIALSAGTVGTWSSGGFVADAGAPAGVYELGVPNAAFAAGVPWVLLCVQAPNLLDVLVEFELDHVDGAAVQASCGNALAAYGGAKPGDAMDLAPGAVGEIAAALQEAALPHNPLARVGGDLEVLVLDDYTVAATQPLRFPVEGFPTCPADSVSFQVFGPGGFQADCTTAVLAEGVQQVTVADVSRSDLAALPPVDGVPFRCWCQYAPDQQRTLREGTLWLRRIPR